MSLSDSGSTGLKKSLQEWIHHFKWHLYVWPAFGLLGWLLKSYVWPLILHLFGQESGPIGEYAATHPLRFVAFLLTLVLIGVLVKVWLLINPILLREKRYAQMLAGAGLREFGLHDTEARRELDWGRCVDEIESTRPSRLCILGATGWETFGSPQSPIHEVVKQFDGPIQILLIKPQSGGFLKRTSELNRNPVNYAKEIRDSVAYCRELVSHYKKQIEVRLYEDEPIWKMIFSDRYLWLQYYDPKKDVDQTPVYTFQTRAHESDSSLYYPLYRVFQKRWTDSRTHDAYAYFKI